MLWYLAKLVVLLPLIGLLAWGSLRLAKRLEGRFATGDGTSGLRIVETRMLSPTLRLAVIAFHDREILVHVETGPGPAGRGACAHGRWRS